MLSADDILSKILPEKINQWELGEQDQYYGRDNLFEYINGGAELYLSYGFTGMINRVYSQKDQPDIVVDIFDMTNSYNAFGVFVHSRERIANDYGQGSQSSRGMVMFWKDRFLVSILAYPETAESKEAIKDLARQIDARIIKKGPLPDMLNLLPKKKLHEESIRYFKHYIWLNSHFFIADENILDIDERSEALLAKYGHKKELYAILLINYPGIKCAEAAFDKFKEHYLPELSDDEIVQLEDEKWTGGKVVGTKIILVFNSPTRWQAERLIGETAANIEKVIFKDQ